MEQTGGFATYPSLRHRVIIVTGGASGIGAAIVEAFAMQNAQVAFLDIQDEAAEQLTKRLTSDGATVPVYYHCDVTDITQVQHTVQTILHRFHAVDVLVNNAGNDTRHTIAEVTPAFWDQAIAVNLKHQFFMIQALIPSMQKAQRGSIINMSSIGWVIPSINQVVYVTSKAGIVGMTRTLAHELGADNVRVNCIMPGPVMLPPDLPAAERNQAINATLVKREGTPEHIARAVLFFLDNDFVTGVSLPVDGGRTVFSPESV